TNSLVDLVVFGRRAGQHIAKYVTGAPQGRVDNDKAEWWRHRINRLKSSKGTHPGRIFDSMQETMMEKVGVYRTGSEMEKAVSSLQVLRLAYKNVSVHARAENFNAEVQTVLELGNLLDLALHTASSALNRQESRGAHTRDDFPDRNDGDWLKHSLSSIKDNKVTFKYRDVDVHKWEPKPRIY
ncbi:MAG: hypothetical protein PF479_12575, partial [Oceanispirochaeta sp.]